MEQSIIKACFKKLPRLHFITIRGADKYQKIGKINDMMRRVGATYFIVREEDKQKEGRFHFHALISLNKDITPNWYRKGVHINVQPLNSDTKHSFPESYEEAEEIKHGENFEEATREDDLIANVIQRLQAKASAKRSLSRKTNSIENIVNYMFKDNPSTKYLDYIFNNPPLT